MKGFTKAGGVAKVGDIAARADYTSEVYAQLAETDRQISTLKKVGREGIVPGQCELAIARFRGAVRASGTL